MKHLTDSDLQRAAEMPASLSLFQRRHLGNCSHCQSQVHLYRRLFQGLRAVPPLTVGPHGRGRIMQQIVEPSSRATSSVWTEVGLVTLLAALGFSLYAFLFPIHGLLDLLTYAFRLFDSLHQGLVFFLQQVETSLRSADPVWFLSLLTFLGAAIADRLLSPLVLRRHN